MIECQVTQGCEVGITVRHGNVGVFCTNHYSSVLIMDFNNIATCLGMTFLYWGMCNVCHYFLTFNF